jgi:hypothetical protein
MKFCNLVIYFSENEKDLGEKNLLNIFSFTFLFVCTSLINLEKISYHLLWNPFGFYEHVAFKIALNILLMLLIDLIILCQKN